MARTTHQYAVRLSVDGGGRVQAELRGVGDSGDRSLRKIDRASGVASRGLGSLTERASSLRSGIRLLGGALAGIATVGGLSALIDRSLEAADAIGKTADKLGIGVEALQELRYAASLAGVEQNTLDMALQRFTRRGERVLTGAQQDATARTIEGLAAMAGREPAITVLPTVYVNAPNVTARTQASWSGRELRLDVFVEQVEESMARNLGRGEGLAPVMERRYGLNPAAGAFR